MIPRLSYLIASLLMELVFMVLMVLVLRYGLGLSTIDDDMEKIHGYLEDLAASPVDNGGSSRSVHVIIPDNPEATD